MKKLPAVEDARAIMTQGMEWGVWKWLLEKKRVRQIADRATEALNDAEMKVKATWSEELKAAYDFLLEEEKQKAARARRGAKIDPEILLIVRGVKEADDEAEDKRLEAEDTFDDAERRLSTEGARQGARKALETYDLHEKAIRKAETAMKTVKNPVA